MATCSLAAARVRDGAVSDSTITANSVDVHHLFLDVSTFQRACQDSLPADPAGSEVIDVARSYALLAVGSIQDGRIKVMHKYIGLYFTLLSIHQFHDEVNWPEDLTPIARDEMRRLYWSMYTLDIFTSIIWDSCPHHNEAHAKVRYPETIDPSAIARASAPTWIDGWNFTTDLYRVLEHLVTQQRTQMSHFNFASETSPRQSRRAARAPTYLALERVDEMYANLSPKFKAPCKPITGSESQDVLGFQVANIEATLALLRMVCLSLESDPSIEQKCAVVSQVLSALQEVPPFFLQAISTPLVYHLGGIGAILGTVIVGVLSDSTYRKVRALLENMADLLENMEAALFHHAGAGQRLRGQIERMDHFAQTYRTRSTAQSPATQPQQGAIGGDSPADIGLDPDIPIAQLTDELSPQFQLPDSLLQDWTWPFGDSQMLFPL